MPDHAASIEHIRDLIRQGRGEAAMAALNQALAAMPYDPERRYLRGVNHRTVIG